MKMKKRYKMDNRNHAAENKARLTYRIVRCCSLCSHSKPLEVEDDRIQKYRCNLTGDEVEPYGICDCN